MKRSLRLSIGVPVISPVLFYSLLSERKDDLCSCLSCPELSWAGWSAFIKSDIRRSTPRQAPSVCIKVTLLIESHDHSTTHFIQLQPTIWYWSLIGSWSETGDVSWFYLKVFWGVFLMIKPYRSVKLILGFVCFGSVYLLCRQFPCILSRSGCAPAEVGSVGWSVSCLWISSSSVTRLPTAASWKHCDLLWLRSSRLSIRTEPDPHFKQSRTCAAPRHDGIYPDAVRTLNIQRQTEKAKRVKC